ncbi:hypothetical protein [Streptomyces sp. NPDC046942]|uniref:hypothetical protein n=1 Tax=Streptomyces sp. NPDC046942 TaxID=3155137 RepID=UPI0033D118E2
MNAVGTLSKEPAGYPPSPSLWFAQLPQSRNRPPDSEIASRLVIRTGKKRGRHPAPATVMRMLREHDEQAATAPVEPTA